LEILVTVLPKLWILKKETKKRKKVMGEVEKSKKKRRKRRGDKEIDDQSHAF